MCIRDRCSRAGEDAYHGIGREVTHAGHQRVLFAGKPLRICLLYTSDAADERSSVDLGGRRIIKKKITPSTVGRLRTRRAVLTGPIVDGSQYRQIIVGEASIA